MDYRPGVMSEALAQRDNIAVYWSGLLMFKQYSHPATYRLAQIALRVANFRRCTINLIRAQIQAFHQSRRGRAPLNFRLR